MAPSALLFGIARLFANVRSAAQLDRESIVTFRIAAGCVLVADALLRSRGFWHRGRPGHTVPGTLIVSLKKPIDTVTTNEKM